MNITISATEISDLHVLGAPEIIPVIIGAAREVVTKGGTVIIEQRFGNTPNAPPQEIARFRTLSEIDEWEKRIKDFIKQA